MSDTGAPPGAANDQPADPPAGTQLTGEDLARELAKTRRENADWRVKHRDLAKQLEDAQPLIASAKEAAAEARQLKVDLALAGEFHRKGVKPQLARLHLIDRGLMSRFDPAAPDFDEVVEEVVAEAMQQVPELQEGRRSSGPAGAEFPGPAHVSTQLNKLDLAGMEPAEVLAAFQAGKFDALMGKR